VITMGAPPALGPNFFARLDVPTTPGLGAIFDLGFGVGPLKTFILRGAVPERARFTVLASMDGVRFDEAMLFTADQQGARSVSVICRFMRVRRAGAGGQPPLIAVGAEPVLESVGNGGGGGGLPDGPFVSFGDESAKTTSTFDKEEVLEEFAVPDTILPGASPAVTVSFSVLGRKSGTQEGAVRLQLRTGGQPGTPDGIVLAAPAIVSSLEQRIVARSAPIARSAATLIKITGQGNGFTKPVLRGLVVYIEPAPGGTVVVG